MNLERHSHSTVLDGHRASHSHGIGKCTILSVNCTLESEVKWWLECLERL